MRIFYHFVASKSHLLCPINIIYLEMSKAFTMGKNLIRFTEKQIEYSSFKFHSTNDTNIPLFLFAHCDLNGFMRTAHPRGFSEICFWPNFKIKNRVFIYGCNTFFACLSEDAQKAISVFGGFKDEIIYTTSEDDGRVTNIWNSLFTELFDILADSKLSHFELKSAITIVFKRYLNQIESWDKEDSSYIMLKRSLNRLIASIEFVQFKN